MSDFTLTRSDLFSCDDYKLFFHLWGHEGGGGLNWRLELKIFIEEEAQWHTVIPEQGKKSYADVVKTPHVLTGAN
jgi:hypothetical protein